MDLVDTIVTNPYGEILMVRRGAGTSYSGYIGFPGGKVDDEEPPVVAAARELREETGLRKKYFRNVASFDLSAFPIGKKCRMLHVFSTTAGYDDDPENLEPHKHSEVFWMTPGQILAEEKKMTLVDEAIRRFLS